MRNRRQNDRAGVVLILVTVVIVMLSLAGLSFVLTLGVEHKAVDLHGDELRLQQAVASGVELMSTLAEQSAAKQQASGGAYDNADLFRGASVANDEVAARHAHVTIVSPRWNEEEIAGIRYGWEDECNRLNLGVLPQWDQQSPGSAQRALMCLPGMTEAIAAKILDWVDPDDAMRPGGAEREQYSDLHVPYAPRNGCPARLEELLLIPDMSRDLLFGRDLNLDYQLSAHETGDRAERMGSQTGGIAIPWASLLTLYSAERNVNARGLPRIFLNEPNLRKLHGQLTRVMEPAAAEFIIWYRQLGPVSTEKSGPRQPPPPPMMTGPSPGPSMGVPAGMTVPSVPTASAGGRGGQPPTIGVGGPMQGAAGSPLSAGAGSPPGASPSQAGAGQTPQGMDAPLDLDRPARFTIDSVLDLIGARVMASPPGSREPKFLESPFAAERTAMQSYLPALLDETSVTADVVLRGRVNINTAPRAVLRAAPGMDERLVETICSNRTVDTENTGRQHPIWLLTEGLVDLQTMRALLPNMTCGGGVFRAQVVGYFEEGGPVARAEVVVDATVRPPRPVLWTDLRIRGHGIARGEL